MPSPIPQGVQLEDLLDRFDDLRRASQLAKKYLSIARDTPADDFVKFLNEVTKVKRAMKKGILSLYREEQVRLLNESIQAYNEALSGEANFVGKFVIKWRSLNRGTKVRINSKLSLPLIIYTCRYWVARARKCSKIHPIQTGRVEATQNFKVEKLYDRQT